ncbi:PAS domain S-box protein [Pseudoroseicyclus sp. H15]
MRMSTRLMAPMVGLVLLTALSVGLLVYYSARAAIVPQALAFFGTNSAQLADSLKIYADSARQDVQAIANSGIAAGIARTQANGGTDPQRGLTTEDWYDELARLFMAELAASPAILQLRLISASGQELVRVDRASAGEPPRRAGPEALQDKSNRDYVAATMDLPAGTVYVSRLDLNRELGEVEVPLHPVLRIAAPLRAPAGADVGFIILNLDMRDRLDALRSRGGPPYTYLVNNTGDFLLHPDPTREYRFEFGAPYRLADAEPALAEAVQGHLSGTARSTFADGTRIGAGWATVALAGGPRVTVIRATPVARLLGSFSIGRSALIGGGLVAVLAALLAMLIARSLSRPIDQITHAVQNAARGQPADLPVTAAGEVGALARAFADHIERGQWYEEVIEGANDAIFTCTPEGRITRWNRAAEQMFGASAQQMIGQPIETLVAAPNRPRLAETIGRALAGERLSLQQEDWRRFDTAAPIALSLTYSPVRAAGGEVTGVSAIARDIGAMRAAQETLRILVEASPIGKVLIDERGVIDVVNRQVERQFGYAPDALIGRRVEMLLPGLGSQPESGDEAAQPSLPHGGEGRDMLGLRADGSTFPVEIALTPVDTPDGPRLLISSIDISDRKAAMDALKARERELKRSNADLEQFAYVASHDLQEPLRMVASFTELLAQRYEGQLDERAQRYIGFAVEGARRMQQQINDLLVYSRVGSRKEPPVPTDASAALRRVMAELAPTIRETGAEITVGELPVVTANPGNLGRLFQNLISNALKFHESGPLRIEITAEEVAQGWHFTIADNGIGFDSSEAEQIFEMFQRLHGRGDYSGTGLGLAICKRIVEQYGGRIWAESTPGAGATFHFILPAAAPESELAS